MSYENTKKRKASQIKDLEHKLAAAKKDAELQRTREVQSVFLKMLREEDVLSAITKQSEECFTVVKFYANPHASDWSKSTLDYGGAIENYTIDFISVANGREQKFRFAERCVRTGVRGSTLCLLCEKDGVEVETNKIYTSTYDLETLRTTWPWHDELFAKLCKMDELFFCCVWSRLNDKMLGIAMMYDEAMKRVDPDAESCIVF